jgi:hypothetical protein
VVALLAMRGGDMPPHARVREQSSNDVVSLRQWLGVAPRGVVLSGRDLRALMFLHINVIASLRRRLGASAPLCCVC